jgi:hypothetical protein
MVLKNFHDHYLLREERFIEFWDFKDNLTIISINFESYQTQCSTSGRTNFLKLLINMLRLKLVRLVRKIYNNTLDNKGNSC